MRLRSIHLPLLVCAAVACRSNAHNEQGPTPEPAEPTVEVAQPSGSGTGPSAAPVEASAPANLGAQDEVTERVLRRRQARQELAKELVAQGRSEIDMADLEAAAVSFSQAVQLDPQNEEAVEGLRRVQSLLGDDFQTLLAEGEEGTERVLVQIEVARLEARDHVLKADEHLRNGEYAAAIEEYQLAQVVLAHHPMLAQGDLDRALVDSRLAEALRLRDEAEEAQARADRMAAEEAMARIEAEERMRRENQLEDWYQRANQAFMADKYGEAEKWCEMILRTDPSNAVAQDLQRVARELRHSTTDERNRKNYREQWLKTMDELSTLSMPQTDPLLFNLERWKEIADKQPLSSRPIDVAGNDETAVVLARLDEVRFQPPFDETPLESVASYLQSLTGVNFHVSARVLDELDEDETSITLALPAERSVRKALDLIAETRENLRWKVADGVVKFVVADELTGGQILLNYSVHDLITPIPDYPGRDINVSPSGGIVPPDEDLPERDANVIDPSLLEDLIRNTVAPESWDADPANSIRITEVGTMVVNQTPEVQDQIASLLDDLREATGIMVDIQARFMTVEDNFLEDIGVDFRGLGQPGGGTNGQDLNDFGDPSISPDIPNSPGTDNSIGAWYDEGQDGSLKSRMEHLYDTQLGTDDFRASGGMSFQWTFLNDMELELILRAVSKSERIELVTAPRILVHNAARANLSVLNQVAYVQDFDVEIAQAASIADPIVAVIQDGVILDVRPVVSADRRFINLELRPTIANLTRPIEQRATTLGSSNSVTIELPEVEIQRVRTSVPMPDGATVMLGGNKISEKQDKRSGVPILNKIPIVSALFERKGSYISNKKLLILLRSQIVIPAELEPTPAEMGIEE